MLPAKLPINMPTTPVKPQSSISKRIRQSALRRMNRSGMTSCLVVDVATSMRVTARQVVDAWRDQWLGSVVIDPGEPMEKWRLHIDGE